MPKKLPSDQKAEQRKSAVARFLLDAFLDWQRASGEPKSQLAFAEHLGLKRSTLTKLLSGRVDTPERDTVELIAARCGPGIYDAPGMERPDPLLQVVIANWGALSREQRDEISAWLGVASVGPLTSPGDRALAEPAGAQAARAGASRGDGRARPKRK